jgi:hypothetical protein
MKNYFLILSSLILFYSLENDVKSKIISESDSFELKLEKDSLIVFGKITDNVGDSFKYAKVEILNSKQEIKVNENGNYKIDVFKILNKKNEITIKFSFLGFKTEKRTINKKLFNKNNKLEMNVGLKEDRIIIVCPNGK